MEGLCPALRLSSRPGFTTGQLPVFPDPRLQTHGGTYRHKESRPAIPGNLEPVLSILGKLDDVAPPISTSHHGQHADKNDIHQLVASRSFDSGIFQAFKMAPNSRRFHLSAWITFSTQRKSKTRCVCPESSWLNEDMSRILANYAGADHIFGQVGIDAV